MCVPAASMLCSWQLRFLAVDSGNLQSLPIASAPTPFETRRLHTCFSAYVRNGFADIVELLLAFQADTESTETAFRRTCLHIAATRGFLDVARLLLQAKADKDRTDKNGNSALALAAGEGQAEVVSLLLKAAAAKDNTNVEGQTPLFRACMQGQDDVAGMLLHAGADRDKSDLAGDTPLIIACKWNNMDHSTSFCWPLGQAQTCRTGLPRRPLSSHRCAITDVFRIFCCCRTRTPTTVT